MLKWRAPETNEERPLETTLVHFEDLAPPPGAGPFWTHELFEGPTGCLGTLHAHLSVLEPGAGYDPHTDEYDVAIVPLEGTIETLGQRAEPWSVVYYGAGELHGLRNVGTGAARYLVFEFHSPPAGSIRLPPPHRRATLAVVRGGKQLARPLWRRIEHVVRKPD
jgi:quercetin dioxygenase-like cupin family protein